MAVEEPKFELLAQDGPEGALQLRRYAPAIVAETVVEGDRDTASTRGFKAIADYIFGNNRAAGPVPGAADAKASEKIAMTAPVVAEPVDRSQKIAMTAPVSIQQTKDKWRVQFTMPSQYTLQTLPKPNNPNIEIVEVPAQTYGVMKFSGLAGAEKVAAKTKELQSWMQGRNLTITGKPELARYNPPWTLPFLRRNEVMIAYQPK